MLGSTWILLAKNKLEGQKNIDMFRIGIKLCQLIGDFRLRFLESEKFQFEP